MAAHRLHVPLVGRAHVDIVKPEREPPHGRGCGRRQIAARRELEHAGLIEIEPLHAQGLFRRRVVHVPAGGDRLVRRLQRNAGMIILQRQARFDIDGAGRQFGAPPQPDVTRRRLLGGGGDMERGVIGEMPAGDGKVRGIEIDIGMGERPGVSRGRHSESDRSRLIGVPVRPHAGALQPPAQFRNGQPFAASIHPPAQG